LEDENEVLTKDILTWEDLNGVLEDEKEALLNDIKTLEEKNKQQVVEVIKIKISQVVIVEAELEKIKELSSLKFKLQIEVCFE
jgi:hypothetical protein